MIIFRYKKEFLDQHGNTIKRPIADIFIQSTNGEWIEFHPYIDSGADVTLIPLSLGKLLGFKINEKAIEHIGGIHGSVPVIYLMKTLQIGDKQLQAAVAWALVEEVPPLLGRRDVFDHFDVLFQQKKGVILLSEKAIV